MEQNNDFQFDENIETITDVDSIEDHDTLLYNNYDNVSETSSQYDLSQYSLADESLMIVEEDVDSSSVSDLSSSGNIEVKKQKVESVFIKISDQNMFVNDKDKSNHEIKISDQQVPIKHNIASAVVMNSSKNANLSLKRKNDSLNLETIAIPKIDTSKIIKINHSVMGKTPFIVSSTSIMKPTTSDARLQPKSNMTGISYNRKTYSKPKQELKSLSNESNSEMCVVPHNVMNMLVRNGESRNQSLKSNSMPSIVNAISTVGDSINQQKKVFVTTSKVIHADGNNANKFVARVQKFSDGKFKMIQTHAKVPVGLENVLKHKSQCVKPKSSMISHQYTRETTPVQQNLIPTGISCNKIAKTYDFGKLNINKRIIPHTVTSKDALENSKNIAMNTNIQEKLVSSGFIQLLPRTESLSHSDGQSLNITRYDSLNKSKTKMNTYTNSNKIRKEFPDEICSSKNIINRPTTEYKNNMLLSEEINLEEQGEYSEEDDKNSGQFISCHYEYCETLVFEPELIDDLYCSLVCKDLDSKKMISDKKSINNSQKHTNPLAEKPIIDRKLLLAKLESRINKRKQVLSSSYPEKISRNDDWEEIEQVENSCDEHGQSSQNSSHQISSPEVVEDDNDDEGDDDDVGGGSGGDDDDDDEDDDDDDDDDEIFNLKSLKSSVFINDSKSLKYVESMRIRSAVKKLFDTPFPNEENFFKVGQRLEGIDPKHEALFCVMTVVEVCGYRIKLHFDGYPHEYDFWVNADCPDIFYPRWCEQNSRTLQPPKHYGKSFNWDSYTKEIGVPLAPKWNFSITKSLCRSFVHKFRVGAKLEALDKLTRTLPKQLICVATIADTLYNRIRIHFDGWTDDFDYWTDITSANIHPVGWCESNGRTLSSPSGYNDFKGKKPFSWSEYLKETNSEPVPEDAFVRRPLRDFAIKMTIEVIDLIKPSLLRIAEVVDVRGDELKVLYDGFHTNYAYWIEDDHPDIHPVGWSVKTNHPIEIPPVRHKLSGCKVMGCNGKGNSYDSSKSEHTIPRDCPYQLDGWQLTVAGLTKLPDRLEDVQILPNITAVTSSKSKSIEHQEDEKKSNTKLNITVPNNLFKTKRKITHNKSNEKLNMKHIQPECSSNITDVRVKHRVASMNNDELRNAIGSTLIPNSLRKFALGKQDTIWLRHNAQLGIPLFHTINATKWSIDEVASYIDQITSISFSDPKSPKRISDRFIAQDINGETFLMLTQDDLLNILKIPLGYALKIHSAINMLRRRVPIFDFIETMNITKKK